MIVTTNLPFSEWTQVIPNARLCKALLDRMVAFCKANRRLGQAGQASLPSPSLPRLMDALDRSLAEMDRRIGELRPLVKAAL